jgi:hypothetical protein
MQFWIDVVWSGWVDMFHVWDSEIATYALWIRQHSLACLDTCRCITLCPEAGADSFSQAA